jgi:hypothetical protein
LFFLQGLLADRVNVDNLPLLVLTIVSLGNSNFSVFFVSVSFDVKNQVVVDIGNELSFIGKELPPG